MQNPNELNEYVIEDKQIEITDFAGNTHIVTVPVKVFASAADKDIEKMRKFNQAAPTQSGKKGSK